MKKTSAESILARAENLLGEPEVRKAAEAHGRAVAHAEAVDRAVKGIRDQLEEAEDRAATALLEGTKADGDDLPVLRVALQRKRDDLRVAETAVRLAEAAQEEAAQAACARLAEEFRTAYRAEDRRLSKVIDDALRTNCRFRDIGNEGRRLFGNSVSPDVHYYGLVPATSTHHPHFADWRAQLDAFL